MGTLDRPTNGVRLSRAEIESLLNQLDTSDTECDKDRSKRTSERHVFRHHQCKLGLVKDYQGVAQAKVFYVTFRNLSEGGICCLYNGFIHESARCFVELPKVSGGQVRVNGTVRRCQYVADGMHEVGIQFDEPIVIDEYIRLMQKLLILVVDDDKDARRLAKHYLSGINATIHEAEQGKQAVQYAESLPFNLVLMDLDMPEMNGADAIQHMRNAGFDGTVAAVTAVMKPAEHEHCLLAGADTIIQKPYLKKNIDALLTALNAPPVTSEFIADQALHERIRAFIGRIPRVIRHLQESFITDTSHAGKFAKLVKALQTDAATNGYSQLSETAGQLYTALSFNLEKKALTEGLKDTLNACLFVWMSGRKIALLPEELSTVSSN